MTYYFFILMCLSGLVLHCNTSDTSQPNKDPKSRFPRDRDQRNRDQGRIKPPITESWSYFNKGQWIPVSPIMATKIQVAEKQKKPISFSEKNKKYTIFFDVPCQERRKPPFTKRLLQRKSNGQWEFKDEHNQWKAIGKENNTTIENAYQAKRGMTRFQINGVYYNVYFAPFMEEAADPGFKIFLSKEGSRPVLGRTSSNPIGSNPPSSDYPSVMPKEIQDGTFFESKDIAFHKDRLIRGGSESLSDTVKRVQQDITQTQYYFSKPLGHNAVMYFRTNDGGRSFEYITGNGYGLEDDFLKGYPSYQTPDIPKHLEDVFIRQMEFKHLSKEALLNNSRYGLEEDIESILKKLPSGVKKFWSFVYEGMGRRYWFRSKDGGETFDIVYVHYDLGWSVDVSKVQDEFSRGYSLIQSDRYNT